MEINTTSMVQPYLDMAQVQKTQEKTNQVDSTSIQSSDDKLRTSKQIEEKTKVLNGTDQQSIKKEESKQEKVVSEKEQKMNTEAAKSNYQQTVVANTLSLSGETNKLMTAIQNNKSK